MEIVWLQEIYVRIYKQENKETRIKIPGIKNRLFKTLHLFLSSSILQAEQQIFKDVSAI